MTTEFIDLTEDDYPNSPPSSPRISSNTNTPMVPNFNVVSTVNPNLHFMIHPHQSAQWQAPPTYDPFQVAAMFYRSIHVGQVPTILEPVSQSNIIFLPNGVRLREPWTQREHELLLMGIIEFGNVRWSEIARNFVWSTTPQQVQIYSAGFFWHQAGTYVCDFMRRNQPIGYYFLANGNCMSTNINSMYASASYSMPMIVANEVPLETVPAFQNNAHFPQIPPCGGESSSNNMNNGGGPRTSGTTSDDGEIDLELRLG